MFLFKVVTCLLLLVGVRGNHFELSEFIQRIHKQTDSATVCFLGFDGEFLDFFSKTHFDNPVAIFTSLPSKSNKQFYKSAVMLVVQDLHEGQQHFDVLSRLILRLRVRKFVIISARSTKTLERYFSFFKENKFTRIFGMVHNTAYAYLPYADNRIQILSKKDALPDALKDLNGFTFRTTVQKDIPRTFWYPDSHGRPQIGGCFGQIFIHFLRRHNATFKEIILNNSTELSIPDVLNATGRNQIDISMNGYGIQKGHDNSYPVKFVPWTVMVPLNGYVNPNEYFLRPFSPTSWICIGLILLYIILMDVFKDFLTGHRVDAWHSFSRIVLNMLNMSADRPVHAYRFHAQVLILAFILGNIYVIYFTSFLTIFIKIKQYERIQDLIDNNVRIMVPDYEWDIISKPDQHLPGLEDIITLVDYATYFRERNSMSNYSFAYSIGADRGEFLIGLQTFYAKPTFRLTRDGLTAVNLIFPLAPHSPFKEILNNFIFNVLETGLIWKWDEDSVSQGLRADFQMNVDRGSSSDRSSVPLTLDHLRFAWICLAIGLTFAVIVVVGEKIWQQMGGF